MPPAIKIIVSLFLMALPWKFRRLCLLRLFGFDISESAFIGFSMVAPDKLVMGAGSKIGHLNVIKGISSLTLLDSAEIGRLNWITGFPQGNSSRHFDLDLLRVPELMLGEHAAITNRHLIDCTDSVSIGRYATVAGFRTQILTHSISIEMCRQRASPVSIGDFCFVGTGCVILPGSGLPNCSMLGAGSVLTKRHTVAHSLYAGNPARLVRGISETAGYFHRQTGYVV